MRTFLINLLALVVFSACGGSSKQAYTLSAPLPTGSNAGFYLTDQPTGNYSSVFVTVKEVRLHLSSGAEPADTGWKSITLSPTQKLDLLTLQNGVNTLLGGLKLDPGTYSQLRLILSSTDGDNYVISGGTQYNLTTPSASQTGIKIQNLNLTIDASNQFAVILDFDANKSVVKAGNKYNLKPVIQAKVGKVEGGKVETSDTGASNPNQ